MVSEQKASRHVKVEKYDGRWMRTLAFDNLVSQHIVQNIIILQNIAIFKNYTLQFIWNYMLQIYLHVHVAYTRNFGGLNYITTKHPLQYRLSHIALGRIANIRETRGIPFS